MEQALSSLISFIFQNGAIALVAIVVDIALPVIGFFSVKAPGHRLAFSSPLLGQILIALVDLAIYAAGTNSGVANFLLLPEAIVLLASLALFCAAVARSAWHVSLKGLAIVAGLLSQLVAGAAVIFCFGILATGFHLIS